MCISWSTLPPLYSYNPTFPLEAMSLQPSVTAVSYSPSLQVLRLTPYQNLPLRSILTMLLYYPIPHWCYACALVIFEQIECPPFRKCKK